MVAISTRISTPPVPGVGGMKDGRPYTQTVTITDRFVSSDVLVAGVSADEPTTYGDLTEPHSLAVSGVDQLTFRQTETTETVIAVATFESNPFAADDHVWVCLFEESLDPQPTDVPLAVSGPFIVAA